MSETKSSTPAAKQDETVTVSKSQLEALLARIDKLEAQKADEIEISTDLPQAAGLKPGQYVNIAPPTQAPDYRKVRWTKASIEQTYPAETFVPLISVTVAPHGIPWNLTAGEAVTVPNIVKAFHDSESLRIRTQYNRYRPESVMEVMESIQRSKENPGQPIWGRLHLVGSGFNLGPEQSDPVVPAPPAEAKAPAAKA